jgi:sodium-independent sulfate anion transporter 11
LDCSHISSADFTAAKGFKAMISDFKAREQPIIFYNTASSVVDTFLGVNMDEFVVVHSMEEMYEHLRGN